MCALGQNSISPVCRMTSLNVKSIILALCLLIASVFSIRPNIKISNRILGGRESGKGFFPYYAMLSELKIINLICGGSIISEWHILTAAHCVNEFETKPEHILVSFGFARLTDNKTVSRVDQITVHPGYDLKFYHNDIALMKLSSKIIFSKHIQPIALAQSNVATSGGWEAVMCGFGINEIVSVIYF